MILCMGVCKKDEILFRRQVDRIYDLCNTLRYPVVVIADGVDADCAKQISHDTTIVPVDFHGIKYPFCSNMMFGEAAKIANSRELNFIWIEPDVLILNRHFISNLETELLHCGKQALLTASQYPPHDVITGNGAYRSDFYSRHRSVIDNSRHGWDGFMLQTAPHDVHRTKSIWHKYGVYDRKGSASPFELTKLDVVDLQDSGVQIAHKLWSDKVYEHFK